MWTQTVPSHMPWTLAHPLNNDSSFAQEINPQAPFLFTGASSPSPLNGELGANFVPNFPLGPHQPFDIQHRPHISYQNFPSSNGFQVNNQPLRAPFVTSPAAATSFGISGEPATPGMDIPGTSWSHHYKPPENTSHSLERSSPFSSSTQCRSRSHSLTENHTFASSGYGRVCKRKGSDEDGFSHIPTKQYITEERMTQRLMQLSIDDQNPVQRKQPAKSLKELEDRLSDLSSSDEDDSPMKRNSIKFRLAPELGKQLQRKTNNDPLLPRSILQDLKKQSMAVVLWSPPGGIIPGLIAPPRRPTNTRERHETAAVDPQPSTSRQGLETNNNNSILRPLFYNSNGPSLPSANFAENTPTVPPPSPNLKLPTDVMYDDIDDTMDL